MKTCPLCNKTIENDQYVTAILAAKYRAKEGGYDLEVTRQAILSHIVCPTGD